MRNDMISREPETQNLVRVTLEKSARTALKKYEKDLYDESGLAPSGWKMLIQKHTKVMNDIQTAVFKAVHRWRDTIARQEDESTRYVLPHHLMFHIAAKAPVDYQGLLNCMQNPPPMVRIHAAELARIIKQTKLEAEQAAEERIEALKNMPIVPPLKEIAPEHLRFEETEDVEMEAPQVKDITISSEEIAFKVMIPIKDEPEGFVFAPLSPSKKLKVDEILKTMKLAAPPLPGKVISPQTLETREKKEEKKVPEKRKEPEVMIISKKQTIAISEIDSLPSVEEEAVKLKTKKRKTEIKAFSFEGKKTELDLSDPKEAKVKPAFEIEAAFEGKDKRMSVNPRSGNRSMHFK